MFTIVHSGNYTIEERPSGMDTLTKTIVSIDALIAAVLIALEAFVLVRYIKKKKKAA